MKNQIGISQELVNFQIELECHYKNTPPELSVYINDMVMFEQKITQTSTNIKFDHLLNFDSQYLLKIIRSGKHDSDPTQMLIIRKIIIDGIDVQNLIWAHSWYQPQYPEVWYQQQVAAGQTPDEQVPGETWLGHNGIWTLPFSSPFWRHLIEVMQ